MTNEQILKKAIEKVIKNGWNEHEDWGKIVNIEIPCSSCYNFWLEYEDGSKKNFITIAFLLSHSFAKVFFGREYRPQVDVSGCKIGNISVWKIYLQQMVLKKDRIKYLKQFL